MSAHALLIGVTRFSDPHLGALRAPRSDVDALKAVLDDGARGVFNDVVTSIDDDLLTIREKVSDLLENRHPSDMVLFYYSGHGIVDRRNSLFLATGETRAETPWARSLAASEVRGMMEQSRAGRVVVVLDCCHSGVFTEGAKGAAAAVNDRTFDAGDGAEGHYVLTATSAIQYALDSQSHISDESAEHTSLSHFTSWLVDGLGRGEAAPEKPHITLDDLYTYLVRRARQSGAPMTPQRYVKRNSGEMVIARNPAARPPTIPDDLLAKLESTDWNERLGAVAELKDMISKRSTLRGAARKLLRDRLGHERDVDVHDAMVACLAESDPKNLREQRTLGYWESRVLTRTKLELEKLSVANLAELPRCGRAWRNSIWMLWGSYAVGIALNSSVNLWGDKAAPSIWVAVIGGLTVGISGLAIRARMAVPLLDEKVLVQKVNDWDFERTWFRRACWMLIGGCALAALAAMPTILFPPERSNPDSPPISNKDVTALGNDALGGVVGDSKPQTASAASEQLAVDQSNSGIVFRDDPICKITGEGKFLIQATGMAAGPTDGSYLLYAGVKSSNGEDTQLRLRCDWPDATPADDPANSLFSCVRRPNDNKATGWSVSGTVTSRGSVPSELFISLKKQNDGGQLSYHTRSLTCGR